MSTGPIHEKRPAEFHSRRDHGTFKPGFTSPTMSRMRPLLSRRRQRVGSLFLLVSGVSKLVADRLIGPLGFFKTGCRLFQPTRVRFQLGDDGRRIHRVGKSVKSFGLRV
jgi:hypothetical protein